MEKNGQKLHNLKELLITKANIGVDFTQFVACNGSGAIDFLPPEKAKTNDEPTLNLINP